MPESSLNTAYTDLLAEVGQFLGPGRDSTVWSTRESTMFLNILKSGLRRFYWPAPLEGQNVSYEWSFLRPVATLTLLDEADTITLPDDFGVLDGEITISSASEINFSIPIYGEGAIRAAYSRAPTSTGRPMMAGIVPLKGTTVNSSQRFELLVFPTADADYTLQMAYTIHPNFLSGTLPYAYGGPAHAETLLESCLAVAEQRLDDAMTVHTVAFRERLAASVSYDQRLKRQQFGYNGDGQRRVYDKYQNIICTVNGVTPS